MNTSTQNGIYHPLYYLASLGAGGVTVAFWKLGDVTSQGPIIHASMIIFLSIATILFLLNLPYWLKALRSQGAFFGIPLPTTSSKISQEVRNERDPVVSTGWMAMPVSLAMLLNAGFVAIPELLGVSAKLMAPYGYWLWLGAYVMVFILGFQILLNTFSTPIALKKFNFGLFLQPLTYGMVAVPGLSLATMLDNTHTLMAQSALLLGLTAFMVGAFLALLALIFIFLRFSTHGLPEPKVAPTTLLLMPSITVYTIFVLRIYHFLAHHGVEVPHVIFELTSMAAIGLMGAVATLGLIILIGYFRGHVEFSPSWWSFVCPFVALSVLSSITYQFSTHGKTLFLFSSVSALLVAISIYTYVGLKTIRTIHYRRRLVHSSSPR
ncbi:MAG TPA: hypothetical protein EYP25_02740 [Anaerolineae bacterium]|nr:hypothetical protein [Anaerolineae bacterium]